MVASVYSSQYLQTLQLSAVQTGRVTNVAVVDFMSLDQPEGSSGHVFFKASEVTFGPTGYGDTLPPPKSSRDLLKEQLATIVDPVREEYDKATEALRTAWRDSVARGEIAADPDAGIHRMQDLAQDEGALPETMRDMVRLHAESQKSFWTLRAWATGLVHEETKRADTEIQHQIDGLLKQAVINLVDAQLASEVMRGGGEGDKGGMDRAETALQLIWLIRDAEGGDSDQRRDALASIRSDGKLAALNMRRNEMISEFWRKIDANEISFSVSFSSVWGDRDVQIEGGTGMSSAFITKGYHMAAASLSISTSGNLIATRA